MLLFCRNISYNQAISSDFQNVVLEVFAVDSSIFHSIAVGVDGIERQPQELADAGAVGHAQAHEGKDTQFGTQSADAWQLHLLVGLEQTVDIRHEVGENLEDGFVVYHEELLRELGEHAAALDITKQVSRLICFEFASHKARKFLKTIHIRRAQFEQLGDIEFAIGH